MSNIEVTAEDLNVGLQLAVDERDLGARAALQKRAQEIAEGRAKARAKEAPVNAGAAPTAATQARVDENKAEIAGADITPGDDVAKSAAAGEALLAAEPAPEPVKGRAKAK